jgi:hypothetical protein
MITDGEGRPGRCNAISNPDASSGEMPFQRQTADDLDASLLDALLNRQPLPADAPPQARVVAKMLASLAGPADLSELAGEVAARSAFARSALQAAVSPPIQRRSRRPRPSWLPARVNAKLTAGLVATAIGVGGAAAAYADALPDPLQNLAHYLIHAPSPRQAARQSQQHPAGHKPHARPHSSNRGTTVHKGNAHHGGKAHLRGQHDHPKARRHSKANQHHKTRGPGAWSHSKANGHVRVVTQREFR